MQNYTYLRPKIMSIDSRSIHIKLYMFLKRTTLHLKKKSVKNTAFLKI